MNFINEFKRRVAKIDKSADPIVDLKEKQVRQVEVPLDAPLYSIYKRTLPVDINVPVLMNLTEEDAQKAMRRLKAVTHNDPDGGKHAIYYDRVLQSDARQKSPYYNSGVVVKPEGSDEGRELELLRGPEKFNETWVG